MPDWYEENIEPEIRELVRLLRDNGVNTISSCGHEMTIQASWRGEDMYRVYTLIYNHLNGGNFSLNGAVECRGGIPYWNLNLSIGGAE